MRHLSATFQATNPPLEMALLTTDERFMAAALALGARGFGRTWPNPAVGCVIVKAGRVIGRGWTQQGGRPHAETEALARAGDCVRGATAYVTLEPCSNYGRTSPCSKALIDAGIARVVVGCVDPDPRVNGRGLEGLRQAGVEVVTGVLTERCLEAHRGLYHRIQHNRPAVTLKLAQSLDGRIALANGQSKWLTGDLARRHAHRLRAQHDAIMVGSGTAVKDDPMLDCRIDGLSQASPVRVVLDRRGRLSAESKLIQTAGMVPVWIFGVRRNWPYVTNIDYDGDLNACLGALADKGVTRLLVEGGAKLAASLLKADLADRIELFTCPKVLGGDATPAVGSLSLTNLAQSTKWHQIDNRRLDEDQLSIFQRQR